VEVEVSQPGGGKTMCHGNFVEIPSQIMEENVLGEGGKSLDLFARHHEDRAEAGDHSGRFFPTMTRANETDVFRGGKWASQIAATWARFRDLCCTITSLHSGGWRRFE